MLLGIAAVITSISLLIFVIKGNAAFWIENTVNFREEDDGDDWKKETNLRN